MGYFSSNKQGGSGFFIEGDMKGQIVWRNVTGFAL